MIQNGVQEAEAILVGQIQNGVDHREVHSALERAVIGDLLLEDAQNGHHQRDGIEEGEPGGGQAHDGIQTEAGDDGGDDGDDHDQNLIGQLAVGGGLIEICHCGDLADGGGEAGQHHGQAQAVNRDLAAAGADDRQQEVGVADAVGRVLGADAGAHIQQAAIDNSQADGGDQAGPDMGLAEGFTLVALALDAVKEHAGSQEGHQNVAGAVTTQEAVDKGVIHGGGAGGTDGADSALDYQNEQDDGHNGGQDLADLIQCGAAVLGEQERNHEVENDENQVGRAGPDALKAHLNADGCSSGDGHAAAEDHDGADHDGVELLVHMVGDFLDRAAHTQHDDGQNGQTHTGGQHTDHAAEPVAAALQAQHRREDQVARAEVGGEERQTDEQYVGKFDFFLLHKVSSSLFLYFAH